MGKEDKEQLKMTFPRLPTYKQVEEYVRSKNHLQSMLWRSYEYDKPRHSPDLHLTASRRIFEDTAAALAKRREVAKKERITLDEQWKELEEKELELRDTFIKMSSFVKTNQEKRDRAIERCQEETKLKEERTKDIEELQAKINRMQESKKEMDRNIMEHRMYEKYLDGVVGESEDFKNVTELIDRYESLVTTKNQLAELQDRNLGDLEKSKAKMAKMAEENSLKILGLNNVLAELNTRYQTARGKTMHWESIVQTIKRNSFSKYQEISEVKQACYNIYLLMCRRKGDESKVPEEDFEKQLLYIKKTLVEMRKVNKQAAHLSSKKPESTKVEASKEGT